MHHADTQLESNIRHPVISSISSRYNFWNCTFSLREVFTNTYFNFSIRSANFPGKLE